MNLDENIKAGIVIGAKANGYDYSYIAIVDILDNEMFGVDKWNEEIQIWQPFPFVYWKKSLTIQKVVDLFFAEKAITDVRIVRNI